MEFRGATTWQLVTPFRADKLWSVGNVFSDLHGPGELRLVSPFANPADRRQLLQRIRILSQVNQSGVRRIPDWNEHHETPFFVLEPVTSLVHPREAGLLSKTFISETDSAATRQVVLYLADLFDGVSALHRLGCTVGPLSISAFCQRADGSWCFEPQLTGADDPDAEDTERDLRNFVDTVLRLFQSHGVVLPDQATNLLTDQRSAELGKSTARDVASELRQLIPEIDPLGPPGSEQLHPPVDPVERTLVAEYRPGPRTDSVPEQLGRFRLHERLGAGAVGSVYRATDDSNQLTVAVKVLNAGLSDNPAVAQRFSKEARMLARTESPFVARLIDANSDCGFQFLAMEYVGGGPLSRLIRGGEQLTESVALRLIRDAVRGLAAAHQVQIFHRDIKPDNILLTPEGARLLESSAVAEDQPAVPLAKLSDFGLARSQDQSESLALTQDGMILGTPLYMSPEQCRGQAADARSDVYSLGATLFHVLAGRPPFPGDSHVAVMHAHCHDPLPSLARLRPELSEACVAVVEKCLARTPEARYNDATDLLHDLERLLTGEPTSIIVHPLPPNADGCEVLQFRFSCDLQSSPEQLWPYVSNTDRVNHALGLSAVTYSTRTHPERGVERFAETRVAGQRLAWQEHPYEWVEGRRLSVLREFSCGPFLWFMNVVELQPAAGGGTHLTQTFRIVPRNWLGKLFARFELGHRSPGAFRKVYARIDDYLTQSVPATADAFSGRTVISQAGRRRLQQRMHVVRQAGIDPAVAETLRQFLEHASDPEVARIRPLVFAERYQLPAAAVIDACLTAAKEGVLLHLWDILCPSCRIPADVQETLAALQDHAWCPACDLKYEVDFASSVELIFRAHPDVRRAETRTYCIGGPAFSAHVAAQIQLEPQERFSLELALTEGSYRLRGPQLPFTVDLLVSASRGVTRLDLSLLRPPVPGTVPVLRQGTQILALENNSTRPLQIRVERTAGRQMALTAAAVSAIPRFRQLFPQDVLSPGQMVSITSLTMLSADLPEADRLFHSLGDGPAFERIRSGLLELDAIVRREGGAVVKVVDAGVFAVFQETVSAVRAGLQILSALRQESPYVRVAVDRGSALVTTLNERLDYFGNTVMQVRAMLHAAEPNELLLSPALSFDDEVSRVLSEHALAGSLREISREGQMIIASVYRND